jgi:lipopolysaccharide transport system permease protein
MKGMLLGAWLYRHFILSSIHNDFLVRFARSKLGALWMILHPLAQVAIFAFILSAVLSAKLPGISSQYAYAIYLMAGMFAWSLFSEIVTRCLTLFIENGNLLKKIVFPRICLPLIVSGTALINNVLMFIAILVIFGLLGHVPGATLVWLPLLMALTMALALGVGLVLGVINVFVRDVGQVVPVLLQFTFWFTPIVYVVSVVPETYRNWLAINPMYHIVMGYQEILVFNRAPELSGTVSVLVLALGFLGFALYLFRRASAEMLDVL